MQTDYSKHTASRLLEDEYFMESFLYPTDASASFWANQIEMYPWLAGEISLAKIILRGAKDADCKKNLSDKDVNELWFKILGINASKTRKKNLRYTLYKIGAAAAIVVMVVTSVLIYSNRSVKGVDPDYRTMVNRLPDAKAGSKVELVLANNKKLELEGEEAKVEYDSKGAVKVNSKDIVGGEESAVSPFNQLIVPMGRRSTLTFADGTKVWINSGSKLIYPIDFATDRREIFVEGEIFIDVARDESRPFIVKTDRMDVKVLGTEFNVSAYKDETEMNVVLVKGKVEVKLENAKRSEILKPDEGFYYNTQTNKGSIRSVDVNDYIAWKEGYYQFTRVALRTILKKISHYYGKEIESDPKADELICSGKLDLRDSIGEVLINLEKASPIEVCHENERIIIKVKP